MRFLKGLVKGILVFLLVNLLTVLTFSFTTPKVITNGLLRDIVVRGMLNKIVMESTSDNSNTGVDVNNDNIDVVREEVLKEFSGNKELEELLYSKDVENLLNKYFAAFVDGLADDNAEEVDVEEDIVKFVSDHRGELQKISNEEITDEDIEDLRNELRNSDTNSQFKKFIQDAKRNVPDNAKSILSGFKFFVSNSFRLILFIIIAINIGLIAVIDLSIRKTIKTLGWCMNTCGGMIIIFGLAAKFIIEKIVETAADDLSLTNVSIDTSSLIIAGIILLVIGIVLCIIAFILRKTMNNKNESNNDNNSVGQPVNNTQLQSSVNNSANQLQTQQNMVNNTNTELQNQVNGLNNTGTYNNTQFQGNIVNNTSSANQLQTQQNMVSNTNTELQNQVNGLNNIGTYNNTQFQGNVVNNTSYGVQSGNQMNGVNGGSEQNNDLS